MEKNKIWRGLFSIFLHCEPLGAFWTSSPFLSFINPCQRSSDVKFELLSIRKTRLSITNASLGLFLIVGPLLYFYIVVDKISCVAGVVSPDILDGIYQASPHLFRWFFRAQSEQYSNGYDICVEYFQFGLSAVLNEPLPIGWNEMDEKG